MITPLPDELPTCRQTVHGMTLSITSRTCFWKALRSSIDSGKALVTAVGGAGMALVTGSADASPADSTTPTKANRRKRMADGHSWRKRDFVRQSIRYDV